MKRILISAAVALTLVGCGNTLEKDNVVCVVESSTPSNQFQAITQDAVFSCTDKSGKPVSGVIEIDEAAKHHYQKAIKKLNIDNGFIAKYEYEYINGDFKGKYEFVFENGKFAKNIEDGEDKGWKENTSNNLINAIKPMVSDLTIKRD